MNITDLQGFQENKNKLPNIQVYYQDAYQKERVVLNTSEKVYKYILPYYNMSLQSHEEFIVIYLSQVAKVLGVQTIGVGGISCTYVDKRRILQSALLLNATKMILVHNHPSGGLNPSVSDKQLTYEISEAAKLLDITVHDHLIIAESEYYSFADYGLMNI